MWILLLDASVVDWLTFVNFKASVEVTFGVSIKFDMPTVNCAGDDSLSLIDDSFFIHSVNNGGETSLQ